MVNLRMLALPETSPYTGDRGATLTIVLDSDGLCSANSVIRAGQAGAPFLLEVWVIDFSVETRSL